MSKEITREELSAAGVQYGHQTTRWNPKMAPYIYGVKNKNHIINLEQTLIQLEVAKKMLKNVGSKGGKVLFVGTKKTAKNAVKEAALRSGNFYINNRWLGGTLTNLRTIKSRITTLLKIEEAEKSGAINSYTKKEQIQLLKQKAKLETALGGIKSMYKLPFILVVIDPITDEIAVKEAMKLNIPVIALCDTNVDPDSVTLAIPGNDDIQESVNIIVNILVDAYAKGANITLPTSVLKTVAVKKEENERRPYSRFEPRVKEENKTVNMAVEPIKEENN